MIWSLDAELDEISADAKLSISNLSNEQEKSNNVMETLAKVQKVKTNAESDKELVQAIVKKLLVRMNKEGLA